jgi:hypothetical protein
MAINYKRTFNTRPTEKFIVIAVEGEKTEPEYFGKIRDELKNGNIKLEILPPLNRGSHPKNRLAELCLKSKNYSEKDSFYLVCDVDRHHNLPAVIKQAKQYKKYKIQPIISNPCFEVWLYLYYGNIKIKDSTVDFDGLETIEQENLDSQKMKEIYKKSKVNHHNNHQIAIQKAHYKKSKVNHHNNHQIAIQKAQELTKNDGAENFLIEQKYRGKTNVYKLVQEILGKNSQNQNK